MEISSEINKPVQAPVTDAAPVKQAEQAEVRRPVQPPAQETGQPAVSQDERLSEILKSYGFKATEKNLEMLKLMLENSIPLTKESVARMNQALRLTDSPGKALFLIQNGLRLTQTNASQLDSLVNGQTRITEQIHNLLEAVSKLPDPELREKIWQLLSKVENADVSLPNNATARVLTQLTQTGGAARPEGAPAVPAQAFANVPAQPPQTTAGSPSVVLPGETPAAQVLQPTAQTTAAAAGNAADNLAQGPANQPTATAVPTEGDSVSANAQQAIKTGENATNPTAPPQAGEVPEGPSAARQTGAAPEDTSAAPKTVANGGVQTAPPSAEPAKNPVDAAVKVTADAQTATDSGVKTAQNLAELNRTAAEANEYARPRLSFKLADSSPEDIDRFVNTLREALRETQKALTDARRELSPEAERVHKQLQTLSEHIDFVAQMKNQLFVQLPVYYNGQEALTALHLYKDGKGGRKNKPDGTSSALIAIETAFMGHFETYVQKNAQSVNCQFRLRDKNIEDLVRKNIHKLEALLLENHFSLDAFSFLPQDEPYGVLTSPEMFNDESASEAADRVYIFDRKI
jgi:hypothetical protein